MKRQIFILLYTLYKNLPQPPFPLTPFPMKNISLANSAVGVYHSQMQARAYVDGSYNSVTNTIKWGYIIVDGDNDCAEILHSDVGMLTDHPYCEGWQIAGELIAAAKAAKWAAANSTKIDIYYDYIGIYNWVKDIFGAKAPPWKAKKEYVIKYRERMKKCQPYIRGFHKVESHSGNYWNDYIDSRLRQL